MTAINPASTWGRELRSSPPRPGVVTHLTVHWVGSNSYNRTADQIPAGIKQMEQIQLQNNPTWPTINYNFLVDKFGRIWEGRGWQYRNAANGANTNNTTSMSVCVLVGKTDATPTQETINALRSLWRQSSTHFGRQLIVQCHRDVRSTACPGPELTSLVRSGAITSGGMKVTRLQGPNRYETAAAVSRYTFPNGAPLAVVASGTSFPDALTAAPFGVRGPILLTDKDRLPIATVNELKRLKVKEIIIVGGVAAVSAAVEAELRNIAP
jgi:hypothetical protein